MKGRVENPPSADSNNEPVACYVAIELSKSGWLGGVLTPLGYKTGRYQANGGDGQAFLDLVERISAWRAGGLQRGASSAGRRGRCQAPPPRAQAAGCRACAACQSHQRALRGTRHL